MKNHVHHAKPHLCCKPFAARPLAFAVATLVLVLLIAVAVPAQTDPNQAQGDPSANEGIEKGWNEFGVWGGMSFHAPTLIGKTPEARFGNLGLRYGRVLAASENVASST